jgi:hypothetical protein
MTDQELRAWSLTISAILQKNKSPEFSELIERAAIISSYIKTGEVPPKKNTMTLYEW